VLFASLVDDPSSDPDRFQNEEAQQRERQRLFGIIEELVKWENSSNEEVLVRARAEILKSTGGHPPPVLDPFCGGGSIPLEAQRLGLDACASDLNPVAVLITKALIEIPPKFAGRPPIHPKEDRSVVPREWRGAQGLAEDVRYYGEWMRTAAAKRIGHVYPNARLPKEHGGGEAPVIAWIWARTVACPNPACRAEMPLLNSFVLSRRKGGGAWLEATPTGDRKAVEFGIGTKGDPPSGGTVSRNGAICLVCQEEAPLAYVRAEGKAGRLRTQLLCTIAEGARGRVYLSASEDQRAAASVSRPEQVPDTSLPQEALGFRVQGYGITKHWQLFSDRQLVAMTTFADLVRSAREQALEDGADMAYADAVALYLALGVGRLGNRCSSQCFWNPTGDKVEQVFARNAIPMVWVFAEANPFSSSTGNFQGQVEYLAEALSRVPAHGSGVARQLDATSAALDDKRRVLVATDPPYYDNVPYADLSDFFYVWLRRAAGFVDPQLFSTVLVPKAQELIAEPARHGGWDGAAAFFEDGLRRAFERCRAAHDPEFPFTLFYAFKQAEEDGDGEGRISTGWETMLQSLIDSGWMVHGTWPMRTEKSGGLRDQARNALASSIVLVCRPRPASAALATRKELLAALKRDLPEALRRLQHGSIAPVDLAQAAIGPGMAVFSRYSKVIEADGSRMSVRAALQIINQALDDVLTEQESEFDGDTRWALAWFEQHGMAEGPYGDAETLATAKDISIVALVRAGLLEAKRGKVRLLRRNELPANWNPAMDNRLTVWELTQHLICRLEEGGESSASELLKLVGSLGDTARDLAYRLYNLCERKGWAQEATAYNGLVTAWPELTRLAQQLHAPAQGKIF
jgi:putative DNA methylase